LTGINCTLDVDSAGNSPERLVLSKLNYSAGEPVHMAGSIHEWVDDQFWTRHSNPKSGWTRVPLGAVIVYSVYRRNYHLLGVALVWTVINPILFTSPDTADAWMTRAVLAERWWIIEEENRTLGLGYPNNCNTVGAIGFAYALYAGWRQFPKRAMVGVMASVGLKLWWLQVVVKHYDQRTD
jgi:hypothetical protein